MRSELLTTAVVAGTISCAVLAGEPRVLQQPTFQSGRVSAVEPHSGPGLAMPSRVAPPLVSDADWQQASVPGGIYLRAISMGSPMVGFAAGELGRVLRTADGGTTWQYVLNQGFPYYYYGVHAFDANTAIISGFQNQSGEGIIRWTDDGGQTWGPVIALPGPTSIKWLALVDFIDEDYGVVEAAWAGGVHRTVNGGRTANDWTYASISSGWFSGTITYLPDGRVWLAGIDVVYSPDHGVNWQMLPSASPIFDGPIAIHESGMGFIGGGSISPNVAGWVYGTDDGGQSWTPQTVLDTPYPVRGLLTLDQQRAWAVGGNLYSSAGGIWSTEDGGQTWKLELDAGNELLDITWVRVDTQTVELLVCGYISQIWTKRITLPQVLVGDVNCDGKVDFGDINPFVLALTDPGGYAQQYPECPLKNRDINGDGKLDFGDINPFVALLTGPLNASGR